VRVLEQEPAWCHVETVRDGYKGFVETISCEFTARSTTHWVSTKATLVFESPDIKAPVVQRLLFGSELSLEISDNPDFLKLHNGGFVWAEHCHDLNTPLASSMVEIAQDNYLHAPYLWGGRSADGCDCSGMVQMVAMGIGVNLPRDTVDQEPSLSLEIEFDHRAAEDLVFWPGHVGILSSPDLLLHSTAHSMRCCVEPLTAVIQRAGSPSSIRRVNGLL